MSSVIFTDLLQKNTLVTCKNEDFLRTSTNFDHG